MLFPAYLDLVMEFNEIFSPPAVLRLSILTMSKIWWKLHRTTHKIVCHGYRLVGRLDLPVLIGLLDHA